MIKKLICKLFGHVHVEEMNAALSLNKRIFPRCFRARLREIAKLDAEHDKREFEEVKRELMNEFCNV